MIDDFDGDDYRSWIYHQPANDEHSTASASSSDIDDEVLRDGAEAVVRHETAEAS